MGWLETLAAAQAVPPDRAALAAVVEELWPGAEVTAVATVSGGLSSVLHRVDVGGGPVPALVLRQLLRDFGGDSDTVRREFEVHRAAAAAGLPAPAVHWSDAEGDVFGRPALLLDFVGGRPLVAELTDDRARWAVAAAVHEVATVPTDGLVQLPRLATLDDVNGRFGPVPTSSDIVDAPALSAAVDAAGDAFRPGDHLVHMDLHGGNMLWDGAVVTAILDWPGAAVGNPLADESYLWFDTCLAHGRVTADALQVAVDEARPGPPPTGDERHLWRGVALLRGLPSPATWCTAYRAMGLEVDEPTVEARFVALVDEYLAED